MDRRYSKVIVTDTIVSSVPTQMDLVQEMDWEDHTQFLTLEEAGLEEVSSQPMVGGLFDEGYHVYGNVIEYCEWFYEALDMGVSDITTI